MNDIWKLLAAAVVILLSIAALVSSFDFSGNALNSGHVGTLFVSDNSTGNGTFYGSGNNNGVAGQGSSPNGGTYTGNANVGQSGPIATSSGDSFDLSILKFFAGVISYMASGISGFAPWLSSPLNAAASWLSPPPNAPADVVPAATVPAIASPAVAATYDNNMSLLFMAILMIVVFGAIGIILVKRYHLSPLQKPGETDAAGQPVEDILGSFQGAYKLQFPDIGDPFPSLWGAGEPLAIAITDKDGEPCEVSIAVDGEEQNRLTLENTTINVAMILEKGKHRISVSSAGRETSWADIRIVDYREEVVSLFNTMFQSFKVDHSVIEEMTPRELEQAVIGSLPETKREMLDEAVSVFEIANYSIHHIRRHEYERMYISKINVI